MPETRTDPGAPGPRGESPPGAGRTMDEYEYDLPASAVAQTPVEPRTAARLLVDGSVSASGRLEHAHVADLPGLLGPGDVVVVNDTRVLAARLTLAKATGGAAEVLLLEPTDPATATWEALVRPGRRLPPGTRLHLPGRPEPVVEVGGWTVGPEDGRRSVRLLDEAVIARAGTVPLPPYIHRPLEDQDRYQTVYAADLPPGQRSAAAPTAGLHFTPELLDACRAAGATVAPVDLAIGLDTFRPVTAATPEEHTIHTERYSVPAETYRACREAGRVVAVGTTAVRALESAATTGRLAGRTDLYIHGDHTFRLVDAVVTNFHLPRSTLLLLVEAFAGPRWRDLYRTALDAGYRFLSFGDAMVVGRAGPKGTAAEPVLGDR